MAAKLSEGDTVGLFAEIPLVDDDGLDYPVTLRGEHLSLIARRRSKQRPDYDEH